MLNLSKQIYVGCNPGNTNELDEVSIVPSGEAANEKKKLKTLVDKNTSIQELENVPLPGFTMHEADRKNWSSADITCLVIDPRGFLVRITIANLFDILKVTGITEGLIQEKCVWARENSNTTLTLVPVSSVLYKEAVSNTELLDTKVTLADVNIGDEVLLQNKLKGIYMGVLSLYGPLDFKRNTTDYRPQTAPRRQVIKVEAGKYHFQTDTKILKILNKTDNIMTREESAAFINNEIAAGNTFFTNGTNMSRSYYSTYGLIEHVSHHTVATPKLAIEEITKTEAISIFNSCVPDSHSGKLLLEMPNSKMYRIVFPWRATFTSVNIMSFPAAEVLSINDTRLTLTEAGRKLESYYGGTNNDPRYSIDNFVKFYKIVKYVKTESYV
jgi:hypothetical protein